MPQMHPQTSHPARWRRVMRRWAPVVFGAALLLGASEAIWWWQSWPVRHLLDTGVVPLS